MGRFDNIGAYSSTFKTPTSMKYWNGSSWVEMGSHNNVEADVANGSFDTSTLKYKNQLYRWNGSAWKQVTKDPIFSGNLYAKGSIKCPSTGAAFNNAYNSGTATDASTAYFYWEFQGYVRATTLPVRLVGAYNSEGNGKGLLKGFGTSTSGIANTGTDVAGDKLFAYSWDLWVDSNNYVMFRACSGTGVVGVRYSYKNDTINDGNWHHIKCGSYRPTYASSFSSSYRWTSYCGVDGATVNAMRTTGGGSSTSTVNSGWHVGFKHVAAFGSETTSGLTGNTSNMYGTLQIKGTNAKTTINNASIDLSTGAIFTTFTASSNGTWTSTDTLKQDYTW